MTQIRHNLFNDISNLKEGQLSGKSVSALALFAGIIIDGIPGGSAAKGGVKAVSQFSSRTIDDAVGLMMKNPNKVKHLFEPKHNLGGVVSKLGGGENTIRAVLNAVNGRLPASGVFKNVPVNVGGQTIFIRGSVVNGVPRIGTMFIP